MTPKDETIPLHLTATPEEFSSCTVATRLSEEERKDWRRLWERSAGAHLFNSLEFFEAYCQVMPTEKSVVVLCYQAQELQAVLPLVSDRVFGICAWVTPGRAGNYTDKLPLLVKDGNRFARESLIAAAQELGHVYLAEAELQSLPWLISGRRFHIAEWVSRSPFTTLSLEADVLRLMSAGQKRNLRQRIRAREADLKFELFETDLEKALEKVIQVERGSYKEHLQMSLFSNPKTVELIQGLMQMNPERFRIGILSYQGRPAATILGLVHGQTFFWYHASFVEACRQWGAGKMALYFTLEELRKAGFTKADLLRGDSDLKRQFAEGMTEQYDVYLPKNRLVFLWWQLCLPLRRTLKSFKAFVMKKVRKTVTQWAEAIATVREHASCFLAGPKNYLYIFTYSTRQKVHIEPYNPRIAEVSQALRERIEGLGLGLKIHLIGSAHLGISGQRDIDIFIESPERDFEKYVPALIDLFGSFKRKSRDFIEWLFVTEGYEVELVLIDPKSIKFQDQLATFHLLGSSQDILRAYEQLKLSAHKESVSMREYQKRKLLFFHRISKTVVR